MIKVKARWNSTTNEAELSNKLSFKSRLNHWSRRSYDLDSYSLNYGIGTVKDVIIAPTSLSTWSK